MGNKKQVVWITGASSGIGEALAYEYAGRGAKLILSARNQDSLHSVSKQCDSIAGSECSLVLPLDITDHPAIEAAAGTAFDWQGRIDLLINNAGVSQRSLCLETDMDTYRTLFEVDVFGQIALTKAVLPRLIEQGNGHLAVTASVAGKVGVPLRTGYCAAKHAVMGFFDALRSEVAHQHIKVSTITPGFIRTNLSNNALSGDGKPFGKTDPDIANGMSAEECAKVIVKGLERGKPEIAVGKGIEMSALWVKRLSPSLLFKIAARRYTEAVSHIKK